MRARRFRLARMLEAALRAHRSAPGRLAVRSSKLPSVTSYPGSGLKARPWAAVCALAKPLLPNWSGKAALALTPHRPNLASGLLLGGPQGAYRLGLSLNDTLLRSDDGCKARRPGSSGSNSAKPQRPIRCCQANTNAGGGSAWQANLGIEQQPIANALPADKAFAYFAANRQDERPAKY